MTTRWLVRQVHGPGEYPVIEIAGTRRFEGAIHIRDDHADSAWHHLHDHAAPGDRVVAGTGERLNSETVVLYGPTAEHWIETWIERAP